MNRYKYERELENFYIDEIRSYMEVAEKTEDSDLYMESLQKIRDLEAARSKAVLGSKQLRTEQLKAPVEIAKVVVPIAAWIAVSKWAIKIDVDGVFHSGIIRSIVGSKPRIF